MGNNRVLGKGLSALIHEADLNGIPGMEAEGQKVISIEVEDIGFNPDQPRKFFNQKAIEELSSSIKSVGLLQPVLLRRVQEGDLVVAHKDSDRDDSSLKYCVVAGERRVRAARMAGLETIPALVCSYEGTESLKIALLENIQREDLGPVEEAEAYRHLMNTSGATQDKLADMLGKSRSTIANTLRLLMLEPEILSLLQEGKISRGHGKVLLGMAPGPSRVQLAKTCYRRGLSVRECEHRIRQAATKPKTRQRRTAHTRGGADPAVKALMERAEQVYGSPVIIKREAGSGKGTIMVRFYSDSDLVRLLKIMGVDTDLD